MPILVDKNIKDHEVLVRCLIKSHLKKNALKPHILEPKKGENDVSLLRLDYTNEDFCIHHGQRLTGKKEDFGGLLYFTKHILEGVNHWAKSSISAEEYSKTRTCNGIECEICYSPMDENEEYLPTDIDVYVEDQEEKGWLPMHSDLRYKNEVNTNEEQEETLNTPIRKYALELQKRVKYQLLSDAEHDVLGIMHEEEKFQLFERTPLLSIIVPFFNSKKYIKDTAENILSQSQGKNVEVIFINDEDPEGYIILKEVIEKYPSTSIYYGQKHKGLAITRNRGLEIARGKFVWFVDSDDRLPSDAISRVLSDIQGDSDVDVFIYQIDDFDEQGSPIPNTRSCYAGDNSLKCKGVEVILEHYSYSPVQKCVFKKSFIFDNELFFRDIALVDLDIMPRLLLKTDHVKMIPSIIYHYYHHPKSNFATKNLKERVKEYIDLLYFYKNIIEIEDDNLKKEALYITQFRLLRHIICDPKRNIFISNYRNWNIKRHMPYFREILKQSKKFSMRTFKERCIWLMWYINPKIYKWFERKEKYVRLMH